MGQMGSVNLVKELSEVRFRLAGVETFVPKAPVSLVGDSDALAEAVVSIAETSVLLGTCWTRGLALGDAAVSGVKIATACRRDCITSVSVQQGAFQTQRMVPERRDKNTQSPWYLNPGCCEPCSGN